MSLQNILDSPPFIIDVPRLPHGLDSPREKLIFLLSQRFTSAIFYMKNNPVKNYLPIYKKIFITEIAQKSAGSDRFAWNSTPERHRQDIQPRRALQIKIILAAISCQKMGFSQHMGFSHVAFLADSSYISI
jgi:hypothetical protein